MPGMREFSLALAIVASAASAEVPLPVHVGGRVIRDVDGSLRFGWPATYFESAFSGASVTVALDSSTERMRLLIDGGEKALLIQPGTTHLTISNLPVGEHTIRLEKLTESQSGGGRFLGFSVPDGATPLPAPVRRRQIEFIGDSFTVGYGDLSPTRTCTGQQVHDLTDSQQAFGPLLARAMDADYRVNAYSGFGIVRNYGGAAPGLSVPVLYPRLIPEDANDLETSDPHWHPQIIVINLGTNDFSTPLHAGEAWADDAALRADYQSRYVVFARGLMTRQPQAQLILMASDMFYNDVQQIAAALNKTARVPMITVEFGGLEQTGCNYHPSLNDHRALETLLANVIQQHPEIWSST